MDNYPSVLRLIAITSLLSSSVYDSAAAVESSAFVRDEIQRLTAEGIKCPLKGKQKWHLDHARDNLNANEAVFCHLQHLKSNDDDVWAWSSLCDLYDWIENSTYKEQCSDETPVGSGLVLRNEWRYLAPFTVGKAEVDGDPIEHFGGIRKVAKSRYTGDFKAYSELLPHGEVRWEAVEQKKEGDVLIAPRVDWGDLVRTLGSTAITEWQGWAVASFAVNTHTLTVDIQCLGVHTFFIDEVPLTGDVYHRQQYWSSIKLKRGIHNIYIQLRAKISQIFNCKFRPSAEAIKIHAPHFLPDLYGGYFASQPIALPVTSSKWITIDQVTITDADSLLTGSLVDAPVTIYLGQTLPLLIQLKPLKLRLLDDCKQDLPFTLTVAGESLSLKLRCRNEGQSFLFTFVDHDGSVQHAAAIEPILRCSQCPVVLSLHGTTVTPQNQADGYKRMEGGKFIFGVDNAWLLAPTRHGAHNWEGPGALTALTAVERLQELTKNSDWLPFKSTDKLIVTGHSMGGHGAWHLATHYPDKVIALISLAGWNKKEEYGDSNVFFRHDISSSGVDPRLKAILESCVTENEVDRHVSNLKGIPVLARIGSDDRTVHPYFVRRMYRQLKEHEVDVSFVEIPGKEHWWWDTRTANDGGCVNDQSIRDFIAHHVMQQQQCSRDGCAADSADKSKYGEMKEQFTLTCTNPTSVSSMRGLRIHAQKIPMTTSTLRVTVDSSSVSIKTKNVREFRFSVSELRPLHWCNYDIQIDGKTLSAERCLQVIADEHGCLRLTESTWEYDACHAKNTGPARRIAEKPFHIDIIDCTEMYDSFAVYLANLFFFTSDAYVRIDQFGKLKYEKGQHNVIKISKNCFISKRQDLIDKCGLSMSERTGALHIDRDHLYVTANDYAGLRDVISLAAPTIPPMTRSPFSNLVPDFVITGPDFGRLGPAGYECAGFFDEDWEIQPWLSSCSHFTL